MNDRPHREDEQHIRLTINSDYAPALSRALKRWGVEPDFGADAVWALVGTPDGACVPVSFDIPITLPDGAVPARFVMRGVGDPENSFTTSRMLELDLSVPPDHLERGRVFLAGLLELISEERRMECRASEHFLGNPPDIEWHERTWPAWRMVAVHQAIEVALDGWTRVRIGSPRAKSPVRQSFVDEEGRRHSLFTDVRYFLRRGDAWMVFDVTHLANDAVQVRAAAAGIEPDQLVAMLERIDTELQRNRPVSRRSMTASGEDLRLDRKYTWDELFLAPALKRELQREVEWFFANRELYDRMKMPYRRGLLLHGLPGTGKTFYGKVLASLRDMAFIWVTAGDVSGPSSVHGIFERARRCGRAILFFEDLDFYASHRSVAGRGDVLGELLVQLDGMHSNEGLFVVATTNDLTAIEPAIRDRPSRFDRIIEISPGPEDVRLSHLHHLLAPFGVDQALLAPLGRKTEGFTGAQLQELALVARRRALERGEASITAEDLEGAVRAAREFKARPIGFESASRKHDDFTGWVEASRSFPHGDG